MTKKGPLLFTIFNDAIGWGIVLTIFAPLFFDSSDRMLPSDTPNAIRNILLGILIGSFGIAQFLSMPVIGALSDHFGRKQILEWTIFGSLMSFILSAIAILMSNLTLLFFSRLVAGLCSGNAGTAQASIADMSTEKTKAKNLSLPGMVVGISWMIGPPLGGFLSTPGWISWFNYSTPFWFLAFLFLLNFLWVHSSYIETLEKKEHGNWKQEIKDLSKISKIPHMKGWLIVTFFFYLSWFTFKLYYPAFFVQKFQFTQESIGYFYGYLAIFWLMGSFVLNRYFGEKIEPKKLLLFLLPIEGLALFVALWIGSISAWVWTFPILAFFGSMGWIEVLALTSNLAGKVNQGKIFGITQSLMSLAVFVAPFYSGFLASYQIDFPLYIGAISFFATSFFTIGLHMWEKRL